MKNSFRGFHEKRFFIAVRICGSQRLTLTKVHHDAEVWRAMVSGVKGVAVVYNERGID